MFSTSVLSKYLKIHDGLIGSIAGVFTTLAAIYFMLARTTWQIYTGKFLQEKAFLWAHILILS